MNVDPSYPRFRQHSSPPQTPPLPPIDDTFLFVPHSSSSSSDLDKISHFSVAPVANGGEFPYLAYLGYKTLGWAIIFLAFLLILRFVKVWLLHTWIREADAVLGARISRGIEAAAASGDSSGGGRGGGDEVVYEIRLRVESEDINRSLLRAIGGRGGFPQQQQQQRQYEEDRYVKKETFLDM
jgi:hypothetical protein